MGHEIKEIRNFESDDSQDYSRKANICKHHQDENRFFCVNCGICICRDCVVLEHQDHKKISLQHGIENNEVEIEAKMCEVRVNRSRLITVRKALEERKLKQGSDIAVARNLARSDRGRNRKKNNSRNGETHSPSEQSSYSADDKKSAFGQSSSQSDFSGNASKINPLGNDASQPLTHYSLGPTSSSTVHNHPLSAPCHTSPPGGSYSIALQRNTAGSDARPPRTEQPAASGGKRGSDE